MNTQDNDMINLRAAIFCEYAANALRAAHTYESAASIYGVDTTFAIGVRVDDGIDNLRKAAEILGFKLTPIVNSNGDQPATEPQDTPILSTAGGLPQNEPPAFQDIDQHSSGYSAGLSGRVA